MRLASALIGALTVLFTYLLARELAPGRPWLGVLAALLVAYQPMYGAISGAVNSDVGLNAGAAALELLLLGMLRRGITVRSGAITGVILLALPVVKGTGLSLYPVAALVFLAVLWRNHRRADLPGWIALAAAAALTGLLSAEALGGVHTASAPAGAAAIGANASAVSGALGDIPGFLSYLWQVFLPRLPFMAVHFPGSAYPAYSIFVIRGWAAFGSYTVTFPHWVYVVILIVMLSAIPLGALAARLEWAWVRRHRLELAALVAMPVAVIVGFEAAYYTPGVRPVIAEVGRYAFPAIGPLALLVVGALHAFGRRRMLGAGIVLLVATIALSYGSQLLTLTSFYA
jgi:4-amino-4-deoxy-L-arabinose transferase-like glycosyltransferase